MGDEDIELHRLEEVEEDPERLEPRSQAQRHGKLAGLSPGRRRAIGVGLALLLIVVIAAVAGTAHKSGGGGGDDDDDDGGDVGELVWQLSGDVVPHHYVVALEPNLETLRFAGRVTIHATVVNGGGDEIMLHSSELTWNDDLVVTVNGAAVAVDEVHFFEDDETVTIELEEDLPADAAVVISVSFVGVHNDELKGFYRSKYTDVATGEPRNLVVTQFEATDARRAFPCFDEPVYKATFEVSLTVASDLVALSNMPVVANTPTSDGRVAYQYDVTPVMSTYLVAFCVGDLDYVQATGASDINIPVRVYTVRGRSAEGAHAAEVALKTLDVFGAFVDIPYVLPKCDLLAIPDFAAGAMENWGMITFRETALLIDEAEASASNYQRVDVVVAHELAHQWWGNLITARWWSTLWINEGFATFMEYYGIDEQTPEYQLWDQFVVGDTQRAMRVDANPETHSIVLPQDNVNTPGQISEMFDSITYSKGGSVLRMVTQYYGMPAWGRAMNYYLNKRKYTNPTTADLWGDVVHELPNGPTVEQLSTWTSQPGFPLVDVRRAGNTIHFVQQRFSDGAVQGSTMPMDGPTWWVPLTYAVNNGAEQRLDMAVTEASVNAPLLQAADTFKVNVGMQGFYRVRYDADLFTRLKNAWGTLPVLDRANLVNDYLTFAVAGGDVLEAFELVRNLQGETSYVVWESALSELLFFDAVLVEQPCYGNYLAFLAEVMTDTVAALGWEVEDNEPFLDVKLRPLLLRHAGLAGDSAVVEQARTLFWALVDDGTPLNANVKSAVYVLVSAFGGEAEWEALHALFTATNNQGEQRRIMLGLASTRHPYLIQRTLEMAVSGKEVRLQDAAILVDYVAYNPYAKDIAWRFFRQNFEHFSRRGFGVLRVLTAVTHFMSTEFAYKEAAAFFTTHPPEGGERTVAQALEAIKTRQTWLENHAASTCEWLQQFEPAHST